jgi:hypothetical protein
MPHHDLLFGHTCADKSEVEVVDLAAGAKDAGHRRLEISEGSDIRRQKGRTIISFNPFSGSLMRRSWCQNRSLVALQGTPAIVNKPIIGEREWNPES